MREAMALVLLGAAALSAAAQAPAPRFEDPHEAYAAGVWDQALEGFVDLQVERPEDPEVFLNVGAAHYQMRNYPEAERAFARATLAADAEVREQALYNLGNAAYRQGRLTEAVELYKAALEIDPADEDAKFNLEFVRDEIRRRHEEARKRQEEQSQQPQQEPQQRQQEGQQEESGEGQQAPPQPEPQESPEQEAPEPEPGSEEGEERPAGEAGGSQQPEEEGAAAGEPSPEGLSEEEAARYLQALMDAQPARRLPPGARRSRPEKDW